MIRGSLYYLERKDFVFGQLYSKTDETKCYMSSSLEAIILLYLGKEKYYDLEVVNWLIGRDVYFSNASFINTVKYCNG